jgi:putative membrane protein
MKTTALILTALVALEHLYILWIEMFAWETAGKKTFKGILPDNLFKPTKSLAANQGLYNGFLAAGLIWSFVINDLTWAFNIRLFFLSCVIVAAIFGSITASKSIILKQGVPAILAITFLLISNNI